MYILFCESPIESGRVDPDYIDEYHAAKKNGFKVILYSYEDLVKSKEEKFLLKNILPENKTRLVIYRGWMLTPYQYGILYHELLNKNLKLINSVEEYQNCHYLPDSLKFIEGSTPKTIYQKIQSDDDIKHLIAKTNIFGSVPVILKDYVKSEKHAWEDACFVKDASDKDNLELVLSNLINLRGELLNEGIVVREFVDLKELTIHSKSGMPLTEEYRLFFLYNKLITVCDYWEEGEYKNKKLDTGDFEIIAKEVKSNFFSMDIARMKDGGFIIIELGDGQVTGLPEKENPNDFYHKLFLLQSQENNSN